MTIRLQSSSSSSIGMTSCRPPLESMRALVSGSTGFFGGFLCSALKSRGFEVHAVSHCSEAPGVERIDLTSSAAWATVLRSFRPEHVFHLSGVMYSTKLSDFALHNTAAAGALLDAALELKPAGAVLLVGTAAEYGIVPEAALPVVESYAASPRMPYGASKYAQTQLALDAARRGLRVVVARPSNVIGPGLPVGTALGSFARQLREIELGRAAARLSVGDLSTRRDFIDVRDVVAAFIALALHPHFTGIVNVSSAEHHSMRWLLEQLIESFALVVSVEVDPTRLRAAEVQNFSASNALWQSLVGAQALIPLATSLRDLVRHERAQTA
ncbi:MAG: NAD-dependent epimerase/dehydratase family protein [Pseudomonadota bacterium]